MVSNRHNVALASFAPPRGRNTFAPPRRLLTHDDHYFNLNESSRIIGAIALSWLFVLLLDGIAISDGRKNQNSNSDVERGTDDVLWDELLEAETRVHSKSPFDFDDTDVAQICITVLPQV